MIFYQVLKAIFRYLDLTALKSSRLVCRIWSEEAAKFFNHKILIWIGTCGRFNSNDLGFQELSAFLSRSGINHACVLSLLQESKALKYNKPGVMDDPTYNESFKNTRIFHGSRNILLYHSVVFDHLILSGCHIIKLRLEMVLVGEEDAKLLQDILTPLTNLKTLELDLVRYQIPGLISPILQISSFPATQTLGLRFHEWVKEVSKKLSCLF